MLRAILGLGLLLAAACAAPEPDTGTAPTGEPAPTDTAAPAGQTPPSRASIRFEGSVATPAEREACAAAGGVVEQAGLLGAERCTQAYDDAGKPCMDTSECDGLCLVTDGNADFGQPTEAGRCQPSDNPFGCYTEVLDGRAEATLCVD